MYAKLGRDRHSFLILFQLPRKYKIWLTFFTKWWFPFSKSHHYLLSLQLHQLNHMMCSMALKGNSTYPCWCKRRWQSSMATSELISIITYILWPNNLRYIYFLQLLIQDEHLLDLWFLKPGTSLLRVRLLIYFFPV